jgi:sporulation protein YlmC with PRC-barrel domain
MTTAVKKELTLNMPVRSQGGKAGHLERIIADPETHEPAYLVVKRGLIPSRQRQIVVPVSLVREVTAQAVMLDTTLEVLDTFPDYEITVEKRRKSQPDPTLYEPLIPPIMRPWTQEGKVRVRERTVPEHTVDIRRGMTVYDCAGVKLGQAEGISADAEEHRASHLVLRQQRRLKGEQRLIPVDLVDFTIRSNIYLSIGKDHVQRLPLYRPGE